MVRNVLSVMIGYAVWTVIFLGGVAFVRTRFPEVYDAAGITTDSTALMLNLCFSVFASTVAGWLAARTARSTKMTCGWILAGCLLATGISVQFTAGIELPVWYNLAFLYLLVPVTLLGVWMGQAKPKNVLHLA